MSKIITLCLSTIVFMVFSFACGSDGKSETLKIAGIPDQNVSELTRRYSVFTDYLSDELGVDVEYLATTDYSATVTAFSQGDVHMAWFGGLTGVQARLAVPGSIAVAQRARDREFHSVFIYNKSVNVEGLQDLEGLAFAFGSESSTSGHLMPRHFLMLADIDPETFFDGLPIFSGSHDKTWAMVQSGAVQAGALSEAVWEKAVSAGKVDASKVDVFYTTPSYFDYNWTLRADVDETFGDGFSQKATSVIIELQDQEILDLFSAKEFVSSDNSNYSQIEEVARGIGIIK